MNRLLLLLALIVASSIVERVIWGPPRGWERSFMWMSGYLTLAVLNAVTP